MNLLEEVKLEIAKSSLEKLEHLSEWWLDYKYTETLVENENQYNSRKKLVFPLIISKKLEIYEEEY